ncbi:uncharacterized protein LOC135485317 isoform X4 [Lineus longissimus]|uniref:uncharacterized protein LOC135485317 isoform X4 n=1 Tax=Lineus longissimus TaxID=88925 RepID=UPI00315E02D3
MKGDSRSRSCSAKKSEQGDYGIEISGENLEDLLAYDELFLDYFNAFLELPTFPQPLKYDRLTGTFREVPGSNFSVTSSGSDSPPYGATDDERERQLDWAKRERLPLFLRTRLFREMKLCKLLLRPLDDRYSAGGGSSRLLRGYSRQTESYVSSLSNSADNSANEDGDYDDENYMWGDLQRSELYRYNRPGSRALSLPPMRRVIHMSPSEVTTTSDARTSRSTISPEKNPSTTHTGASRKKTLRNASSKSTGSDVIMRNKTQVTATQNDTGVALGTNRDVTFTTRHDTLTSIHENVPVSVSFSRENTKEKLQSQSKASIKKKKTNKPSDGSSVTFKDVKDEVKRAYSAPINYQEFLKIPMYGDFDMMFGEAEPEDTGRVYVAFEDEASEERTYSDMKTLEGKHKMTYQEMKESVLGSNLGIEEFISFLSDTAGIHLTNFWLDCEYFKDSMQDFDEVQSLSARNKLFRDIKDKYRLNLTADAKEQLMKASSNVNLSHTIFIRTQYDVLRRLRAYWVPRFIIHKERMEGFRCHQEQEFLDRIRGASRMSGFFPSISLVNSMPVRPDDVLQIAKTRDWDFVSKGGRRLDDRIKSAKSRTCLRLRTPPSSPLREKLIKAIVTDKAAGGALQKSLEQLKDKTLVSNLLFWQDVYEYGEAESATADRLLRLNNAWYIYNQYIAQGSVNSIGIKKEDRDKVHQTLLTAKDYVSGDLFDDAKNHATEILEPAWIGYLKEDVRKYLECSTSHRDMGMAPPPTADDIEIIVEGDQIIVRRPYYKRTRTPSEKEANQRLMRSLSLAESIDSVRKAELKKIRAEKRKIMERERRKAIRAAKKRLKEMKMKKNNPEKEESKEEKKTLWDADADLFDSDVPPPPKPKIIRRKVRKVLTHSPTPRISVQTVPQINVTEPEEMASREQTNSSLRTDESSKDWSDEDDPELIQRYGKRGSIASVRKGSLPRGSGRRQSLAKGKGKRESLSKSSALTELSQRKESVPIEKPIKAFQKMRPKRGMKVYERGREGEASAENQDGETPGEEGEGRGDSALDNISPGGMLMSGGSRRHGQSITPEHKEVKPPTFAEAAQNKALMTIFKKNCFDQPDGKDVVNMLNTYNEILAYQGISGTGTKQKKDVQAGFIYKSHLDKGSKKSISLTDKIEHRLNSEKDRPKSPTLKDVLHHIKPQLEEHFKNFWDNQAENLGLKGANLANISAAELAMKGDVDVGKGWRGRRPRGKPSYVYTESTVSSLKAPVGGSRRRGRAKKTGGRSQPSRDDKIEFLLNLQQSAMGQPTITMFYFYKYLTKWGEEDGFPQLDKDLFFYLEVQKFKECSHVHADEELLRRKVQSIADTFLDSATPPTLQIDVPADMQQKTLRLSQRYAAGKEVSPNLFDEAQYLVFKNLLPYWAGFMKVHKTPEDQAKKPLTKYQKMLRKRLEMFEQMHTPQRDFSLPAVPGAGSHIAALSFSLNEGIKWKIEDLSDDEDRNADDESQPGTPTEGLPEGGAAHPGRQSIAGGLLRQSVAPVAEVS